MNSRRRVVIVGLIITVLSGALIALFLRASFTPGLAATQAEPVDQLLRVLLAIGGFIFVLCMVIMIYSLMAFRRRPGDITDGPPVTGHPRLELAWTLIPLAIVLILSVQGSAVLLRIHPTQAEPEPETLEINVIAVQWAWRFEYPQYGIGVWNEMQLPVDRPVLLKMTSRDVIHSFWVPEFRIKEDTVPGMETMLHITPNQLGNYTVYCAELCGVGHAQMKAPVRVVQPADFEQWVEKQRQQQ